MTRINWPRSRVGDDREMEKIVKRERKFDMVGGERKNMTIKRNDKALQRIEAALTLLGIVFCPVCENPHNARSHEDTDLDGRISIQLLEGEFVHLCAGCAQHWIGRHRDSVLPRKLGFALASWILDRQIYQSDHPLHETAIAFCEYLDLRFDLLLFRRAKAAAGEMHGRTEESLLASLGYQWDLAARLINAHVLEYIAHVREGGKTTEDAWPPSLIRKVG